MMSKFEGFVPIHTLFYTIFHPTEGSKVCYQFPPGNLQHYDINFDAIKNYIIPKPQLCHRLLTMKYGNYRIVSYPVAVQSSSYARNYFRFNFVFVFPYECATSPYEPAITRLGKMFRVLEEQSQVLSRAERDDSLFKGDKLPFDNNSAKNQAPLTHALISKTKSFSPDKKTEGDIHLISVQDLIMRIYQDLNNYSECLIPIDEGNAIDIKIFPLINPPTSVHLSIEDVPMLVVKLKKIIDLNWDPTMVSILPFINGVNSILNIARLSDSDPELVIECIKHLIYYKCVIITDIFQFSNIYAPSSLINEFLTDPTMAYDCQEYVTLPKSSRLIHMPLQTSVPGSRNNKHKKSNSLSSTGVLSWQSNSQYSNNSSEFYSMSNKKRSESSLSSEGTPGAGRSDDHTIYYPTRMVLFDLYRSLSQGITLEKWYTTNFTTIRSNYIDVRKFIQFGTIKKIIYRVLSYPVLEKRRNSIIAKQMGKSKMAEKAPHSKNAFFSTSDIKFDDGDRLFNSLYARFSKVSFEKRRENARERKSFDAVGGTNGADKETMILTKEEKLQLLGALDNLESFDKICVQLGRSRVEIANLIADIGEYRVINC
ncbi:nitrogen permease regulating protein NPR2 KNAG_0M01140 [Huiozyma naganishii CBS 8797]|uniref:Nitrogen permease regulator 2 n=1 Tax=Huiozyma naganishii (strain ATCC MYA-139 / BCRC 22969 / CBS 8797 / KCTC 17520 / NBRC 10181 / NCYC 3082 / Yp74L-3) TaxID=1071383 RepID=J7S442_HUIN7|nr:hypothetical protein KNAG_0M01140 [Kazachstania naganishii CBS 8797]CCK72967.1 hypothetical protein KNAG_0M01140 [Kazachstania naganishii CBS 8797]